MKWVLLTAAIALGALVYCGFKTFQDFRARRWAWALLGLAVTAGAPTLLGIMAQLMWRFLRGH